MKTEKKRKPYNTRWFEMNWAEQTLNEFWRENVEIVNSPLRFSVFLENFYFKTNRILNIHKKRKEKTFWKTHPNFNCKSFHFFGNVSVISYYILIEFLFETVKNIILNCQISYKCIFLSVMSLESIFTLTIKMFRHLSLFNTNISKCRE